ncbi:MAG: Uma2 family endonuclease [Cyanobacteria bacterium J06623_4]
MELELAKQQYEWWQIPEYWIIDRHKRQIVVFVLEDGRYQSNIFTQVEIVESKMFPYLESFR